MQKQDLKFSPRLYDVAEDGAILELAQGPYGGKADRVYIDQTEDSDDGTWLRVSDYTRFCNKVDEGDTRAIQNFLVGGKRTKCDWGHFILEKDSDDGLIVTFKSPTKVHFGHIGEKPILEEVTKLRGKISYEFFWSRNGRQDKIANGIEFFLEDVEFIG